jgi:hypothetical protein
MAMFDPTVYENMKVVLEGKIYEQDLSGEIRIVHRKDLIDLANMSRVYEVRFCLIKTDKQELTPFATIRLSASGEDLAGEILDLSSDSPWGCTMQVEFDVWMTILEQDIRRIYTILNETWGGRPQIRQKPAFEIIGDDMNSLDPVSYHNQVLLDFGRKLGEEHMDDIERMVAYTIRSLERLSIS